MKSVINVSEAFVIMRIEQRDLCNVEILWADKNSADSGKI